MRKLHGNFKIIVCLFLVISIVSFMKQPAYASSVQDTRNNVSNDKTWTITFNNNVNYDFVNSNYIYVKTLGGATVAIDASIDPTNPKKVIVVPKNKKYLLGETYILTIKRGFSDEAGRTLKDDRTMQFSIKNQLVDTADFKVQVNSSFGVVIVSLNSISDSLDIAKYKVEGQDDDAVDVNGGEAYIVSNKLQNLNVYFYDSNGNQVGSSFINVQKAYDSQVVNIQN